MRALSTDELREKYLHFFEGKGHLRLPSASLVPHGDPTLLFTGAGMVPFKPYFLGRATPPRTRLTTCQRCLRTPDIDHVGHTARHATFFEMLGNFSFGDYFKREAITWAWEFVTQELQLPTDRLWTTVYENDDEAAALWQEIAGLPAERIRRLGKEDNFWEIGVGPCGPCSEIYLDRGPEFGCGKPTCGPGCDCDRFMEFWNLVFIQFFKNEEGQYLPLERKGIDTGMGLDRMAALLQGVDSIFDIDAVRPIVDRVGELSGHRYKASASADVSLRVIADHVRGGTFLAMDGVLPSNEGRGYVMRRLIRRAVRHGRLLGLTRPFLADVAAVVVQTMGSAYPQLKEDWPRISQVLRAEEERFQTVLDEGTQLLTQLMDQLHLSPGKPRVLAGEDVFRLYDTYGFPLELTREIAAERGVEIDEAGFQRAMERQRERARAARGQTSYLGGAQDAWARLAERYPSKFVGYETLASRGRVVALAREGAMVDALELGEEGEVVLDVTPFYAEAGGQVADTGTLTGATGQFQVQDVQRPAGQLVVHRGKVVAGRIRLEDEVLASVEPHARHDTARNHTATHLLHQALRTVLGEQVRQAGSLVASDRLRFDFTYPEPLSAEQVARIEELVVDQILANTPVITREMPLSEALASGAMALFGEKYGQIVRVVEVGDFSRELCGGTHVRRTGEIGPFRILSESGISAGVRRIEAVTGHVAYTLARRDWETIGRLAVALGTDRASVVERVERLQASEREQARQIQELTARLASAAAQELAAQARTVGGVRVLATVVKGVDGAALLTMGDRLQERLGDSVIVLAGVEGDQAQLVTMVSPRLVQLGLDAGRLVREVAGRAGGRGGGRRELGRGAASQVAKLPEVLRETADRVVQELEAAGSGAPAAAGVTSKRKE